MVAPRTRAFFVKQRADFVAIAGRYTKLRRAGRQYVGLCPFHSERYPSFYVEPQRKIFYCFGCEVGGDLFDFIMRVESCDFLRALEVAASSLGVARESEPRSGSRFRAGVGAKPLQAAKRPASHSQKDSDSRSRIIAALDETERRLGARAEYLRARSVESFTACEPLIEDAHFTCHKPDN
jgi:DNA primase